MSKDDGKNEMAVGAGSIADGVALALILLLAAVHPVAGLAALAAVTIAAKVYRRRKQEGVTP